MPTKSEELDQEIDTFKLGGKVYQATGDKFRLLGPKGKSYAGVNQHDMPSSRTGAKLYSFEDLQRLHPVGSVVGALKDHPMDYVKDMAKKVPKALLHAVLPPVGAFAKARRGWDDTMKNIKAKAARQTMPPGYRFSDDGKMRMK